MDQFAIQIHERLMKGLDQQLSFSAGEFSPLLDARPDHPKYAQACRKLQNMIAMKQGGATRRPGTRYIADAKYLLNPNLGVRLMKFQFSPTTSFILEWGHLYVRFFSNGQPVTLSTAPAWVASTIYPKGSFVQDPTNANQIYYSEYGTPATTVPPHLDTTEWVLQNIYEINSPYGADFVYGAQIWGITPCQINDVVYLSNPAFPPFKLTRISDTHWTLAQVSFITPPLLDQNATGVYIGVSALQGTVALSANATAWVTATYYPIGESVNAVGAVYTCIVAHVSGAFAADRANGYWALETIFQNSNIGSVWQIGHVRGAGHIALDITSNQFSGVTTARGNCTFETYGVWTGDISLQRSDDNGITWNKIQTITSHEDHNGTLEIVVTTDAQFRIQIENWVTATSTTVPRVTFSWPDSFVYGLVQIANVLNAYAATGTVIQKLYSTNNTTLWAEGAWSLRRGYPRAVTAFQQRAIYGGTSHEPQRIWGSVTNDLENFALGDQLEATDSFAFDIAAVGRGPIQWLISQVDLFIGFSGAEWIVNAGAGALGGSTDAITPTQISAGEHSSWGSAPGIAPAVVGNAVLYTQRSAKTIQQMLFSVYTNKYMSADLTSLSEHLFGAGVVQMDYQPQFRNQGIVWVVTKTGSLCGMTYQLEQEVFGWHRHLTGLNQETGDQDIGFQSVAIIEGQGVEDDEVWVAVRRAGGMSIELMNPINWETAGTPVLGIAQPQIQDAFYVDAGWTKTGLTTNQISGLTNLVGRYVNVLINGNIAVNGLLVADFGSGTVTIDNYEPELTDVVQVGLPIDYAIQPMRMDTSPRLGLTMGMTKVISKAFIRLFNSLGGKIAQPGTESVAMIAYRTGIAPPDIFTGQKDVQVFSNLGDDPSFIIEGRDALPLTVLSTITRINVAGTT